MGMKKRPLREDRRLAIALVLATVTTITLNARAALVAAVKAGRLKALVEEET